MSPDLRRKVDIARATRLAREEAMKKQADAQVGGSLLLCVLSLGFKVMIFTKLVSS